MQHLYNSVGRIKRLQIVVVDSEPESRIVAQPSPLDYIECRLDLNFMRPGKDQLTVVEAGVVPNRLGVLFCDAYHQLKADDYIELYEGPISGTFQLKAIPDIAIGFSDGHHMEVQVEETPQNFEDQVSLEGL